MLIHAATYRASLALVNCTQPIIFLCRDETGLCRKMTCVYVDGYLFFSLSFFLASNAKNPTMHQVVVSEKDFQ